LAHAFTRSFTRSLHPQEFTMKHLTHSRAARPAWRALAGVATAAVLTACGGGSGETGALGVAAAPSTALQTTTAGTVSGFGSVYVNGVHVEDANATVATENMDGTQTTTALRLGQSVRVALDAKGEATRVAVDAAVVGQVTSVDAATGALKVAGQWVRANTDSAAGPLTVYGGGYTALAEVKAADLVEVHGSPVYSTARAAYEVQATRIEKQSTLAAIRVMGKLASLDSTAKTFAINGLRVKYDTATLAPAAAELANDKLVAVWGAPASLTGGTTPTLTAKRVRVLNLTPSDTLPTGVAELGGLVSVYSAAAKTLEVQGIKINWASATISPATKTLGNGSWIQVRGSFGTDGVMAATTLRIRQADTVDDTARVKLSGAIGSFTDANSFTVRGVPVDATQAVRAASCTGVSLAADVFVNVVASAQPGTNVVLASAMDCPSKQTQPKFAIRELKGTLSGADASTKTFYLSPSCKPAAVCTAVVQKVQWSDQTAFNGLTAESLTAQTLVAVTLKVEGYLDASGTLVAREVRTLNAQSTEAYDKPDDDGKPESAGNKGHGWDLYNQIKSTLKKGG
jgi:hypothetical protein